MGDENQLFGWDDVGTAAEEAAFEALPEGEYDFEVRSYKTERYQKKNQTSKIPDGCATANVTLYCRNDKAAGTIFERLYLYGGGLGRITTFLKSCGVLPADMPEGTPMPMGFKALLDQSVTTTGRCKITVRQYENNGEKRKANNIRFLVPEAGAQAAPGYQAAAPVQYQQPVTQPQYAPPAQQTHVPPTHVPPTHQYVPQPPQQQAPQPQTWGQWS